MAKPIRKSITVWRKTFPDGKEPFNVEAEVIGPFGIYPTFGYSKRGLWTVCHAATGYAVTCNVRGVGAARELCRLLRRLPVWDFDQADAVKNIDPQTVRLIKTHARASHPVWMQAAEADPAPESR